MRFQAIQFIGTQRSGSNLLRLMLDNHTIISAPHPPHLLKTFYPLVTYYGDVQRQKNRSVLVNDMCDWVEANPVPWEGVALNRSEILDRTNNMVDIFREIYEARMQSDKARIWCCKSTFNINYVTELESDIKPFYIYLYRDGRDVTASFKKAIVGPKHTYHLAQKWAKEQRAVRAFLSTIPTARYFAVAYEDILDNPEGCIRRICEKLGIAYEPDMLEFYTSHESQLTADSGEMWKNVLKPVISDNFQKYRKELSSTDIALFESIAGQELELLGYRKEVQEIVSYEHEIPGYEVENREMQLKARNEASALDKEKREAQNQLLQQIKSRLRIGAELASPA